jgi:hypothetical protein
MADMSKLSEIVVLAIKAATAPILERLAATEQSNRDLLARLQEQASLRDRVVTLEAKSGIPPPIDLELHDRLTALEHHAAQPAPEPDLSAVIGRISTIEIKTEGVLTTLDDERRFRDRIMAALETKATPVVAPEPDLSAIVHRLSTVENFANAWQAPAEKAERAIDVLTKDTATLRERMAVVEVRAQIPGPPGVDGKPGRDGANGVNGKDGVDGFGFDDLSADCDGRTMTLKFQKGDRIKAFPLRVNYADYLGVYQDGKPYTKGDLVTWGGSAWHCNEDTTSKPGDGSKDWTLMVKRGRDGRDGVDAPSVPVVKVR